MSNNHKGTEFYRGVEDISARYSDAVAGEARLYALETGSRYAYGAGFMISLLAVIPPTEPLDEVAVLRKVNEIGGFDSPYDPQLRELSVADCLGKLNSHNEAKVRLAETKTQELRELTGMHRSAA